MSSPIEQRAQVAREAVVRAGARVWHYFDQGVAAEIKADATPVTIADREAENLLRSALSDAFPADAILGEESGESNGTSGFRWIIDPLDATKNFIRGIPLFATLVGLEHGEDIVAGFAYVPVFRHLYHAVRGQGAFRDDIPIHVSSVERLEQAMLAYSSITWFDETATTESFLRLARVVGRTRGFGDFYGYLLVADGSIEVMVEPMIAPWDIAALKPIIEEAGGVMTDWTGRDTIYGKGAIAANPKIHRLALEQLHRDAPPAEEKAARRHDDNRH